MNKSCLRFLNQKAVEGHGGMKGLMMHDKRENIWADQEVNDSLRKENEYKETRALDDVRREHQILVKEKTGRRMQAGTMDVREAVVELHDDISMDALWSLGQAICETPILRSVNVLERTDGKKRLVSEPVLDADGKQVKSALKIELFAACLHKDEGHWIDTNGNSAHLMKDEHGAWRDLDGKAHNPQAEGLVWKRHTHGHLWFDVIDRKNGKTIHVSTEELSQLQTLVANKLGMERGEVGSKRRHSPTEIYRMQKMMEDMNKDLNNKQLNAEKKLAVVNSQIEERMCLNETLKEESEGLSSVIDSKRSELDTIIMKIDDAREDLQIEEEKVAKEIRLRKAAEEERNKLEEEAKAMKASSAELRQKLERLRKLESDIASKEEYYKSITSASLLKLIQQIPEKIKAELQSRVAKYWKGKILSYRETKHKVIYNGNERLLDFVDIKMDNKGDMYVLAIELGKGAVWVNGKLAKNESGNYIYMKEVAEFIGTELTPQAKQIACSLFMKEGEKVIQHKDNKGISI